LRLCCRAEGSGHVGECELGRERLIVELRVGRVRETEGRKADEVQVRIGTNGRINHEAHTGRCADINRGIDVLDFGLLKGVSNIDTD